MKEILTIDVKLTGTIEVKGHTGEASMITFEGKTKTSPYFNGTILPGGVDTQKEFSGEARSLSARYILEGTDHTGKVCRLFIENNGTSGPNGINTVPRILTDSEALKWMETAALSGQVEGGDPGHVIIHIFADI